MQRTRIPDIEKERSELLLSITDFLSRYNDGLPESFPRASLPLLLDFQEAYPNLFKNKDTWTLAQHRKKVMDWLPQHVASVQD